MKATIFKYFLLSICIFSLASCSLSKNVSNKGSNEKLRILQQDDIRVCREMVATQTVRRALPRADGLRPFRAGGIVVANHIIKNKKSKVFVASKLAFHKERNAGLNSRPLLLAPGDTQNNLVPKKNGGISIAAFILSVIGCFLTYSPICLIFWGPAVILGIIALNGSKYKGLAILAIIIVIVGLLAVIASELAVTGNGFNFI